MRFGDLFGGLKGISTDLLAAKLRTLQDLGLVEQREIRHPVKAKVYALTEEGEGLRPIVKQLSQWGERLLPTPGSADHRMNHRWMLGSMAASYIGGLPDGSYQLDIDDDVLTIVVRDDAAVLRYGPVTDRPVLSIRCSADWFMHSAWTRNPDARDAAANVAGQTALLSQFFTALPVPSAPRAS